MTEHLEPAPVSRFCHRLPMVGSHFRARFGGPSPPSAIAAASEFHATSGIIRRRCPDALARSFARCAPVQSRTARQRYPGRRSRTRCRARGLAGALGRLGARSYWTGDAVDACTRGAAWIGHYGSRRNSVREKTRKRRKRRMRYIAMPPETTICHESKGARQKRWRRLSFETGHSCYGLEGSSAFLKRSGCPRLFFALRRCPSSRSTSARFAIFTAQPAVTWPEYSGRTVA
jgi:hypothetical protein